MSDNNSIVLLHSHKHVGQRPKNKADGSSSEVRGQRSGLGFGCLKNLKNLNITPCLSINLVG